MWDLANGYVQFVVTDDPMVPIIHPAFSVLGQCSYESEVLADKMRGKSIVLAETVESVAGAATTQAFLTLLGMSTLAFKAGSDTYGPHHPVGRSVNGDWYFWIDASAAAPAVVTCSTTITSDAAGQIFSLFLRVGRLSKTRQGARVTSGFQDGTSDVVNAFGLSSMTCTFNQSGYYSFALGGTFQTNGPNHVLLASDTKLTYDCSCDVLSKHVYNKQLLDVGKLAAKIRVNGSSALMTNTTPKLYQGGMALGYCAPVDSGFWHETTRNAQAETQNNVETYGQEPWVNGFYAYVKPTQYGQMVDVLTETQGGGYTLNGDFADPWGFSVCSISPVTAGINVIAQLNLTQFQSMEYNSFSQVVSLVEPRMTPLIYDQVVQAIREMPPPFSCNESHITRLWKTVVAAARNVSEYAIPFVRTVGKHAAFASALLASGSPISTGLAMAGL